MTQLQESAVPIRYVGKKPEKHDTVNHTGTVWKPDQTLFYPARLARGLLLHPAVWRLGRREDVKDKEDEVIVAASEQAAGAGASGEREGTALHPEDGVPQSALTKDRERGQGGARATLE